MRKWVSIFLALVMLATFVVACGGVSKEAKIKCPKCGAVFTVQEGLDSVQRNIRSEGGGK